MKKAVGLILVVLLIASFIGVGLADVGDDCEDDNDCDSGEVCIDDVCVEEEDGEGNLDAIEKAYNCLEEKVEDKDDCEDLALEEQIFSLLALAYDSGLQGNCRSEVMDKSKNNKCWPKSGGCEIKDTAQALLALDRVGKNTDNIEEWLIENNDSASGLIWYLEIDADEETECEINGNSFEINDDKKINRNAGSCLTRANDNYWFKISESCYDKEFEISCDEDFKAALLYKKSGSDTIYVSSDVKSTVADGEVELTVNALCFSTGSCDYEGSLWAAIALAKTNNEVNNYIPYLMAFAEDNDRYFPETFLFILTGYDEYYNDILQQQKSSGYFQAENSAYNKLYDTALALLALESNEAAEDYLLQVQGKDGCFNGIRDTAFLLYAGFPKTPVITDGGGDSCPSKYYCVSPGDCSKADTLDSYYCSGSKVCCAIEPALQTCSEQNGEFCDSDEDCVGNAVQASDSVGRVCCVGVCEERPSTSQCELEGYSCEAGYYCPEGMETASYSCPAGNVCCKTKSSNWWIWIMVLLILIVAVVLGIIYRNKLRVILFKLKDRFKGFRGFGKGVGPSGPPTGPGPSLMPAAIRPRRVLPPIRTSRRPLPRRTKKSVLDKELDETLKKLKEIGE